MVTWPGQVAWTNICTSLCHVHEKSSLAGLHNFVAGVCWFNEEQVAENGIKV